MMGVLHYIESQFQYIITTNSKVMKNSGSRSTQLFYVTWCWPYSCCKNFDTLEDQQSLRFNVCTKFQSKSFILNQRFGQTDQLTLQSESNATTCSVSVCLSHLVVEEGLGLFDISQEKMENVSLDQNLSPALPHFQQFVPANIELLEPLLQGGLRERSLLGLQQLVHGLKAFVVLFIPARKMQLLSEHLMCF